VTFLRMCLLDRFVEGAMEMEGGKVYRFEELREGLMGGELEVSDD